MEMVLNDFSAARAADELGETPELLATAPEFKMLPADMAKLRANFAPEQLPEKLGGTLDDKAWRAAHLEWIASRLKAEAGGK